MNAGSPTLEQIAEATKIAPRYLKAIESGRLEELPGGIYARSYIRQYADAIGGDADTLLSRYVQSHPEEAAVETPVRLRERVRGAIARFRLLLYPCPKTASGG